MKKLISLLLACLVLFSGISALAVEINFDSMTVEELQAVIAAAEAKLAELQPSTASDGVLYVDDNIKITLNGELFLDYGVLTVPIIIENYVDRNLLISFNNTSCNGWDILEGTASVNALKKAKTEIYFFDAVEAAELASADDVQEITCTVRYFDEDDWDFTIETNDTLTWTF